MVNISDEAKKAFLTDGIKKEVFIEFPNGDHETITNPSIIKESLSFTESICSRDEFKFGLAEASTLEFDCMNVDNIKGKTITCKLRADGKHYITLGTFVVDSCDREADMMQRHVVAYEKRINNSNNNEGDTTFDFEFSKYNIFNISENNGFHNCGYISTSSLIEKETILNLESEPFDLHSKIGTIDSIFVRTGSESNNDYAYIYIDAMVSSVSLFDPKNIENSLKNDRYVYLNLPDIFYKEFEKLQEKSEDIISEFRNALDASKRLTTDQKDYITSEIYTALYKKLNLAVRYPVNAKMSTVGDDRNYWGDNYAMASKTDPYIYPNYIAYVTDNTFFNNIYICIPIGISLEYNVVKNGTVDYAKGYYRTERIPTEIYENYTQYRKNISNIPLSLTVYSPDIFKNNFLDNEEAIYELNGLVGSFWRGTTLKYRKLSGILGRYPSEKLYPKETIYPQDPNGGVIFKGSYISSKYDDLPIKFDRVTVSFEDFDGNTIEMGIQLFDDISNKPETIPEGSITEYIQNYNKEEYRTYSIAYNSIIQSGKFNYEDISNILKNLGTELKKIQYMPADIEAQGMPWLEAGDAIGIETKDGGIVTYILRRTLSGIWFLKDNFESR